MGSPGRCLAAATRRTALRSFTSSRPPCTRRRCGQAAPRSMPSPTRAAGTSAPGAGGSRSSSGCGRCPLRRRGGVAAPHYRTHQQGQGSPAAGSAPPGARARVRAASAGAHWHGIHDTITRPALLVAVRALRRVTPPGRPPHVHDTIKTCPVRVPACRSAGVDSSPGSGSLGHAQRTSIQVCRRVVGAGPGWESSPGVRRSFPRARGARRRGARQDGARDRSRC